MTRYTLTGRLVQGDPMKPGPQRKDSKTGALKVRKDGQPDAPFFVAIAIPKNPSQRFVIPGNPSYEQEKDKLDAAARAAWPNLFQPGFQRPPGLVFPASLPTDCIRPSFANKIIDGDGYDDEGKPNSSKEGWAGCWVVKVSNGFAPRVTEWTDGAGWSDLTPHSPRQIQPGDYITISGTTDGNKSDQSPGMYMNVDIVSFEQEGPRIVYQTAVDANTALGARGTVSAPPPANAPQQPYSGYREGSAPPPPPAGAASPPPPPVASGPVMTDKAGGQTFESFLAAGWTAQQLKEHGYVSHIPDDYVPF